MSDQNERRLEAARRRLARAQASVNRIIDQERKIATQEKILWGSAVQGYLSAQSPENAARMREVLRRYLSDRDAARLGLPPRGDQG